MKDNQTIIKEFLDYKQSHNRSKREEGIAERTIELYNDDLQSFNKDIKNKPFSKVTEKDIDNHLKSYKQSSKNQMIKVYRDFFRWLYRLNENDSLPPCIRNIKPRTVEKDEIKEAEKVITPEEYNLLIENCNKPIHKAILEAFWLTGGRKEEIQTLRVGDVTYDGLFTRVIIRDSKTKSREVISPGRGEYLMIWVESLCPNRTKKDAPLFVINHHGIYKPIGNNYTWDFLFDLTKRIGMRSITPHGFRHTKASNLLKEGVPETSIRTLLGWTKGSMMIKVYDHNGIKQIEEYYHNRKQINSKATYPLLERQKKDLETKHERELQTLKSQVTAIEQEMRKLLRESDKKLSRRDPELHKSISE